MKHDGKKTSLPRVIHNVTRNIFMLIQLRKPNMRCPPLWPEMLKELDAYRTKMKVTKVMWEFPPARWVKYNIDGASRGNPGLSSYAFCLKDDKGDIIYAEGKMIETTTNTVAEAKAILEASCKDLEVWWRILNLEGASIKQRKRRSRTAIGLTPPAKTTKEHSTCNLRMKEIRIGKS
ncbi:hypothetical protein KY289_007311 [Solanum tuberosum]|nr:hypothetical protein KY289_007311 [Solanum tuberosum]